METNAREGGDVRRDLFVEGRGVDIARERQSESTMALVRQSESNMALVRQSQPDSGLGFQVRALKTFCVVPWSLGGGGG